MAAADQKRQNCRGLLIYVLYSSAPLLRMQHIFRSDLHFKHISELLEGLAFMWLGSTLGLHFLSQDSIHYSYVFVLTFRAMRSLNLGSC